MAKRLWMPLQRYLGFESEITRFSAMPESSVAAGTMTQFWMMDPIPGHLCSKPLGSNVFQFSTLMPCLRIWGPCYLIRGETGRILARLRIPKLPHGTVLSRPIPGRVRLRIRHLTPVTASLQLVDFPTTDSILFAGFAHKRFRDLQCHHFKHLFFAPLLLLSPSVCWHRRRRPIGILSG